ncbi:hypothetical protein BgiBS90_028491 [Biomphalaria glabrata]|nr:hypothetical protein BgiBS90_028491 [Biomphalaria glabrata]
MSENMSLSLLFFLVRPHRLLIALLPVSVDKSQKDSVYYVLVKRRKKRLRETRKSLPETVRVQNSRSVKPMSRTRSYPKKHAKKMRLKDLFEAINGRDIGTQRNAQNGGSRIGYRCARETHVTILQESERKCSAYLTSNTDECVMCFVGANRKQMTLSGMIKL